MALRKILDKVVVGDPLRDYAVRLVLATHPDQRVRAAASEAGSCGGAPARGRPRR